MSPPSVLQVLGQVFSAEQKKRYLYMSASLILSARHYYNLALKELSEKNTELAIQNLIFSLNADTQYAPSLHLARTMLYGLSQKFQEEGGRFYKQKYPRLSKQISLLTTRIQKEDIEIVQLRNRLLQWQEPSLINWYRRTFLKQRWQEMENLLNEKLEKQRRRKKELGVISRFAQMEEYAMVLSKTLDVALFPERYQWIKKIEILSLEKQTKQTDHVWFK